MLSILGPVRTREALDAVETLSDWELFESLASELEPQNSEIYFSNEAEEAACDFLAHIPWAYWQLTTETTI
jgi:hypothetical protein